MKLSVGYQLRSDGGERFPEIVRSYLPHVAEVYFPWGGMPSGRAALNVRRGYTDWGAQAEQEQDLAELRRMGVKLHLLFNANCHGGQALSEHLEHQTASVIEHLAEVCGGVDGVTTASLAIAHTVKRHFPQIPIRASVNMRIGTVHAMAYVAHLFDEYCVQRDFNRDLAHLRLLRDWADRNGKTLSLLANSGCLHLCSGQTFHDNLVAHEQEVDETRNTSGWSPILCRHVMRDRANWPHVLRATWIRPEDLHHYEGLIDLIKLATRMHDHPRLVIAAYANRRWRGNLLNLLEPSHADAFNGAWIDNAAFPDDWFARTSVCGRGCGACSYCEETLKRVIRHGEEGEL